MIFVFIPQGVIALILSIIIFLVLKKMFKRQAIKEYESDRLVKNEASYTFSSEGINQQIRRSNNFFEWSDIRLALEREEMFLLYVSKRKAIILPKRFFGSDDEFDLFKNIVSKNIETSKVKFH
ncbi:YcxB family protein [Lentibacillus cibarius]|uniref:YcxB family protein n=1 Tax=Lentibacillus cibarius TaxID=2583219 RepID=A0A549YJW4_9BACI|nr:YcxB family protein [Lentibacillus cibarius]TRM12177.1 YcxB family protein [Lentibacillus cibarius]